LFFVTIERDIHDLIKAEEQCVGKMLSSSRMDRTEMEGALGVKKVRTAGWPHQ
jgi:hypothetical protein